MVYFHKTIVHVTKPCVPASLSKIMKYTLRLIALLVVTFAQAQIPVTLPTNPTENETNVELNQDMLSLRWKTNIVDESCQLNLNLNPGKPLIANMGIIKNGTYNAIVSEVQPEFILNVGKRDLTPEKGWTIFFDKVPTRPYTQHLLEFDKQAITVTKNKNRTVIHISEIHAPQFTGNLEITVYNHSPLINIAAVVSTTQDATAILYDAGLTSDKGFKNLAFAKTDGTLTQIEGAEETSHNEKVKYRTIMATNGTGTLAVFPAPHQYFYPLDEAFNLAFTWHGKNYRDLIKKNGIGIRQNPQGDERFVPWFNAPPHTEQRLNFFVQMGSSTPARLLEDVKKYTHGDTYPPMKGYKTLASHFHNEYIMNVVRKGQDAPAEPEFVKVFKDMGVDIVHLGEFHYTAHPKGPDHLRLEELKALFDLCDAVSSQDFLLLPGEEPNEFLGGHWMGFFPTTVYWIMSRDDNKPFVSQDPDYGKVYRIKDKAEMLRLLELEKGLAWTAHPRIKGSTGYPDAYKDEDFFKSDRFLGGAWKAMPADLSSPKLGLRVLTLLDDMNNWGLHKNIIAESDLFTITQENEMYAHMNINYVKLDEMPTFSKGWHPVLNAISSSQYFSTTGEIMIPHFTINDKSSGETAKLNANGEVKLKVDLSYTFPLNFIEIISGDGNEVSRTRLDINETYAFGTSNLKTTLSLKGKKWARLEAWDVAGNGAFTQTIYLE